MLKAIGLNSMDQLFDTIPEEVKLNAPLDIPKGMSEMEVSGKMRSIASKNKVFNTIFRGAGAYRHYIPSIVKQVTSKEEFMTSYTLIKQKLARGFCNQYSNFKQ